MFLGVFSRNLHLEVTSIIRAGKIKGLTRAFHGTHRESGPAKPVPADHPAVQNKDSFTVLGRLRLAPLYFGCSLIAHDAL
jgi:hypothetical protein